MILQVSGRTDICALYPKWFVNRLKEGYVLVRNPYNDHIMTIKSVTLILVMMLLIVLVFVLKILSQLCLILSKLNKWGIVIILWLLLHRMITISSRV